MRRMGREVRRVRGRGEEKAFPLPPTHSPLTPFSELPPPPCLVHDRRREKEGLLAVCCKIWYLIKYNHNTWLNLTRATVKLPSWLTVANTPVFHWLCSSITSWLNWGISSYRCSGHHPKLKNISVWRNGHPASTSSLPPSPLPRSQEGNAKQGLLAGYYKTNRTYG